MALPESRSFPVLIYITTLTILCYTAVNSSRILLLPPPIYSHCRTVGSIGKSLATLGHTVYAYIPHHWTNRNCLNEHHIKIIKYGLNSEEIDDVNKNLDPFIPSRNPLNGLRTFSNVICSTILGDEDGFKQLASMKFDLAVVDTFPGSKCYLLIPYKLGIPYVSFSPMHVWFETGKPLTPQMEDPVYADPEEMTFIRRCVNTVVMIVSPFVIPLYLRGDSESKFAPELSYYEYISLVRNSLLFIQDDDVILSGALPVAPNTILTGGFSPRPAKSLPRKMKKFVKSAKGGVIVVSFGGVASIPDNIINIMTDAFSNLSLHAVVKTTTDFHLSNVLTSDWIPQNDMLGNNKTKLFISQCGRNGAYESIYHGVPVICLPIVADQMSIAYNMDRLGIGIKIDIEELDADKLRTAISSILSDERFKKKSKEVSSLYKSIHSETAGDKAARAIDRVMKYGGDHMRPQSLELPIHAFLLLDLWILVNGAVACGTFMACCSAAFAFRYLSQKLNFKLD